ncbi:MAG: hypothetical protein PHO03_06725 [Candidatus Omnitrophica bacterium]|nr:hypothetical protein [Candidatus Omnitrophota bacterium]
MKLQTKAKDEWIIIEGENPGEQAEFLVRPPTPKQINALIRQSTNHEWDKNQRFDDIDLYKFKIKKIEQVIIDWKRIEDEDGNPLPCTNANKEIVYLYNTELIDKVLLAADKLTEKNMKETEENEKNFLVG